LKSAEEEATVLFLGSYEQLAEAPLSHHFISKDCKSALNKKFTTAVYREMKLLKTALPSGIFVKSYENRMDLLSCMIVGPQGTPYADGLFFFDVYLGPDYPTKVPLVFFKSMSDRLNPNLYENGTVCLSLLGTWKGTEETEGWTPESTLLQVFVSIQGLILVSEPYFNEAGYEKDKGKPESVERSRSYNEFALLLTFESLQRALSNPPKPFAGEIKKHILENGERILRLLEKCHDPESKDEVGFLLFPVGRGFRLSLKRLAGNLKAKMHAFIAAL